MDFKEEIKKQKLTMTHIAEKAGVEFVHVYNFAFGAFVHVSEDHQIKIINALGTLSRHTYRVSDFVHHPQLPPDIFIPRSTAPRIGARGGEKSIPLMQKVTQDERGIHLWALATLQTHTPKKPTEGEPCT